MSKTRKTTKLTIKTALRSRLAHAGYEFLATADGDAEWTKVIERTTPVAAKDYPGIPAGTRYSKMTTRVIRDSDGARHTTHFRRPIVG